MASISRPTDLQLMQVIRQCIFIIQDRFLYEKGIFRSSSTTIEMRLLRSQMLTDVTSPRVKGERNPHIFVAVLQACLKDLSRCLVSEVYQDILGSDGFDVVDLNDKKQSIILWLQKLAPSNFEVLKSLVGVLARVCGMGDASPSQMAFIMAPYLCHPHGSAFLSIHHQSDLKTIQPIFACIIENYSSIFTSDLNPRGSNSLSERVDDNDAKSEPIGPLPRLIRLNQIPHLSIPTLTLNSDSRAGESKEGRERRSGDIDKERENEKNWAPQSHSSDGLESTMSVDITAERSSSNHLSSPTKSPVAAGCGWERPINFNSWDWKVLENLASKMVDSFVESERRKEKEVQVAEEDNINNMDTDTYPLKRPMPISQDTPWEVSSSYSDVKVRGSYLDTRCMRGSDDSDGDVSVDSSYAERVSMQIDDDHNNDNEPDASCQSRASSSAVSSVAVRPGTPTVTGLLVTTTTTPSGSPRPVSDAHKIVVNHVPVSRRLVASPFDGVTSGHDYYFERQAKSLQNTNRRKLVVECRQLRSEIASFEDDWKQKHSTLPQISDRGAMAFVYARYKTAKKQVRDGAAIDIQRVFRGYIIRRGAYRSSLHPHYSHLHPEASSLSLPWETRIASQGKRKNISPAQSFDIEEHSSLSASSLLQSKVSKRDSDATSATAASFEGIDFMREEYKNILIRKQELKKQLKAYDDDFYVTHGRAPKKAEKEIMRPLYNKYHEAKKQLDDMRLKLESATGSSDMSIHGDSTSEVDRAESALLTFNLQPSESKADTGGGRVSLVTSLELDLASISSAVTAIPDDALYSEPPIEVADNDATSSSNYETWPLALTSRSLESYGRDTSSNGRPVTLHLSGSLASPFPPFNTKGAIEIQEERRMLHAYLKAYEKDFSAANGRPVMKQEDIEPVANEYRRYKALKSILSEKKA